MSATPGPWHAVQDGEEFEVRSAPPSARSRFDGLLIATVWPQADTAANARLIAAAPHLLAAARAALVVLDDARGCALTRKALRDVIKEATGEEVAR